jgi:hypothetical protein
VASQSCEVASRIKIHNSGPSMDRSTKIVQQIKQVFEPYHMMFRGVKEGSSCHHNVSAEEKTLKNTKILLWRDGQLVAYFHFSPRSWNLTPMRSEG